MASRQAPFAVGALFGVLLCTSCTAGPPVPAPEASSSQPSTPARSAPATTTTSRATAIREWEAVAGDHFRGSADALEQVSEASAAEDEAGLREGCSRLHDTNSIGLQADLPTPDVQLTAELQRMIDDMNTATHACLRFALARDPADALTYQRYLGRAVEHLQRAKVILNAARR